MRKSLNRRITVYFLIIMFLTVTVSVVWNYFSTRQSILEMEKSRAEGCSHSVSSMLAHFGGDVVSRGADSENYQLVRSATRNYCYGFGMDSILIYIRNPEKQEVRVLMAVGSDKDTDEVLQEWSESNSVLELDVSDAEKALSEQKDSAIRMEAGDWNINYISWLALSPHSTNSEKIFIRMDYLIDMEQALIFRDFLADALLPVAALGLAFLILSLLIRRRITKPIRQISDRMESFARNSSRMPEPLNISSGDEIGEIAASFEKMTEDISAYVNNIEKLTQERVENDVQLDIARRIQDGFVPASSALKDTLFSAHAMTRPAKGVGGDFYECFRLDGEKVCMVMGDVSGKGITGAIFMAMIKTIIREKLTAGLSPADTLNQANAELMDQNPEGLFATVFAAVLNIRTGELRYANAGHTYPILLGAAPEILIPENGIALGLFEDADIVNESMILAPGHGIMLYTDGVTDALNPQHISFGMNRLTETLAGVPEAPDRAEETLMAVCRAVGSYCEGIEPFDDMAALVLFRSKKTDGEEMRKLPVSLDAFKEIRQWVFAEAGDTPETRKALLACDETLANIVRYSGASGLEFRCEKQEDLLYVTFRDDGMPFDPVLEQAEEKKFEMLDTGGMGLSLIRQTASSMHYERADGKNILSLVFPLRFPSTNG